MHAFIRIFQVAQIITMDAILELGDDFSLPEDVDFFDKKLHEKLSVKLSYDPVMGAFVIRLYKEEMETAIGLRIDALRMIMMVFPRLEAIVNRYKNKSMYMSYRFQIASHIFLTAGQNSAKFGGSKYIDIREYFTTESDDAKKDVPTKVGIRFPLEILERFKGAVSTCLDETRTLFKKADCLYAEVKLFLVEKDIRTARLLDSPCEDCPVVHQSALKHAKSGKCKETISWSDIVDRHFNDSVKGLLLSEVIRLATRVSSSIGELAFCTEELKDVADDELKQSLKRIEKVNRGKIYKHLTHIIEEEEEERKSRQEEEECGDTDPVSEEEEQPRKKKLKVQEEIIEISGEDSE